MESDFPFKSVTSYNDKMQRILSRAKSSLEDLLNGIKANESVSNVRHKRVHPIKTISFCCQCSEGSYTISWTVDEDYVESCTMCQDFFKPTLNARCLVCGNHLCAVCSGNAPMKENAEDRCANSATLCRQCSYGREFDVAKRCGCYYCVRANSADGDSTLAAHGSHYIVLDHEDKHMRPSLDGWDEDGAASSVYDSDSESDTEELVVQITDVAMLDDHTNL